MRRLGIYPGTFDPLHKGHVSFALETIKRCNLEGVVFLPENSPRSKVNVSPILTRIEQINSMLAPYPTLTVQLLASTQFTVAATLPEIHSHFKDAKFTLLLGSDVALSLGNWQGIDTLFEVCDIAVGMRSHQSEKEIQAIITTMRHETPTTTFTVVHTDHPSLASSLFRK